MICGINYVQIDHFDDEISEPHQKSNQSQKKKKLIIIINKCGSGQIKCGP